MLKREEVLAGWHAFMGRYPDEDMIAGHQACDDRSQLVSLLGNSEEFRIRQKRGYATLLDAVTRFNAATGDETCDFAQYVVPTALTRAPSAIGSVLLIGACLLDNWAATIRAAAPGTIVDHVLFSGGGRIVEQAPRPIEHYDCVVMQVPVRMVVPDYELFERSYADLSAYAVALDRSVARLDMLLEGELAALVGRPVFVMNYPVPQQNSLGRLLPRYDLRNPTFFFESLNRALGERIDARADLHLLDIDALAATLGRRLVQDDAFSVTSHGGLINDYNTHVDGQRLEYSAPLSARFPTDVPSFVLGAWAEVAAMMRTLRGGGDAVKMVCVDIDDTIWRGVAAEMDDPDPGIVEGWPIGFAEALAMLRRRGIILALISKNDPARVAEIWPKVFHARLKMDDFAIHKISWNPKPDAVAEAIAQANVLPDSVVFIDDNPAERAAVEAAIPGIRTLGAPHLDWRRTMLWSAETQVPAISDESNRRTEMIRAQGDREIARGRTDRSAFLVELGLSVTLRQIASADASAFSRALELINKTNQFNTTGERWTLTQANDHFGARGSLWTFTATDRFTAYGLVGVLIMHDAVVTQFVMSCRVFGLGIETAVLAAMVGLHLEQGIGLSAHLEETERNGPCRQVYPINGWTFRGQRWCAPDHMISPPHIALTRED